MGKFSVLFVGILSALTVMAERDRSKFLIHQGHSLSIEALHQMYGTLNSEECTPAIKIGPRVYIGADHCPDMEAPEGKTITIERKSEYIGSSLERKCIELSENYSGGSALSVRDANICNRGIDLQIGILNDEEPGGMVSIAPPAALARNQVLAVGACNNLSFGTFQITDVFEEVISITDPTKNSNSIQTCPGDSGGHYLSVAANQQIELLAVHVMGSWRDSDLQFDGKSLKLPAYWHGGIYLQDAKVQSFLKEVIEKHNVEICGINKVCKPVFWKVQ